MREPLGFVDDREPVCECGHVRDEHSDDRGVCLVPDCDCILFDRAELEDDADAGA